MFSSNFVTLMFSYSRDRVASSDSLNKKNLSVIFKSVLYGKGGVAGFAWLLNPLTYSYSTFA